MANRSRFLTAPAVLAFLILLRGAHAQPESLPATSSLRTDRLSPRQLDIWKSIGRLADAADTCGTRLHPKLHGLWQQAHAGRAVIHVEMVERRVPDVTRAGEVVVEKAGSADEERVIVLRLFLGIIDAVEVLEALRRPDGLIPFEGLGRIERYAEVAAHELVHVLRIVEDPWYACQHEELGRETAGFLADCRRRSNGAPYGDDMRERMQRLKDLGRALEAPALEAEREVWRELVTGQRATLRRRANLPLARLDR